VKIGIQARNVTLEKIISGGQTGVDRGALDAALAAGFPCGGACPEDRRAEDGSIPERYPVTELGGAGYRERTRRNVDDSDGTLVIYFNELDGGTAESVAYVLAQSKPLKLIDAADLRPPEAAAAAKEFIGRHRIRVLNVAGPRASKVRAAHAYAESVVQLIIQESRPGPRTVLWEAMRRTEERKRQVLPELTRRLVEEKLSAYCATRIPFKARDRVRLDFRVRGHDVTLTESRPVFDDPSRWTETPIARFRFHPERAEWTVFVADSRGRWHPCTDIEPTRKLDELIDRVDRDPDARFWG
jgi:hypothetical protein